MIQYSAGTPIGVITDLIRAIMFSYTVATGVHALAPRT